MQRVDALAVARVADDKSMRIKLVAQVESGAGQTYKFPLRVSFFGPAGARAAVAAHLAHTVTTCPNPYPNPNPSPSPSSSPNPDPIPNPYPYPYQGDVEEHVRARRDGR